MSFESTLIEAGWSRSDDYDDCLIKTSTRFEFSVTTFPLDDSRDAGCILVEANCVQSGDYYSASAGTISNGYPAMNLADETSLVASVMSQVHSVLNGRIGEGQPVEFDDDAAVAIKNAILLYDDNSAMLEWGI